MPRKAKPTGRTNRGDLGSPAAPNSSAIPGGLPYSEGGRLRAQQREMSTSLTQAKLNEAGQRTGGGGGGGGGAPGGAPAGPGGGPGPDITALAQGFNPGVPGLDAPSTRPGEPVTAGLDIGAGPGSSAVPSVVHPAPDPDAFLWAKYLPAFELMAQSPNSSLAFRQFYRRLRAAVPPGVADAQRRGQGG
jgi:hypothetical protein